MRNAERREVAEPARHTRTVEQGKFADLVLLDADPLKDIHNTTKISEVFLGGKEFDRAALDEMLRSTEVAAKSAALQ